MSVRTSQHFATFRDALATRANSTPDRTVLIFLRDGEADEEPITFAGLHERAAAIGSLVREHVDEGQRAILLYPPGIDYVTALFGCFYAGVVGVSAYPPNPRRLQRTLPRLLAIAEDARANAVLTTDAVRAAAQPLLQGDHALARARWIATDAAPRTDRNVISGAAPDDIAFLQYTSGSTADPRGVMLTHRNLITNSEVIADAFGHTPDQRGFIWLPPYHDMGLIGGILQPVYVGGVCVLCSPMAIVKQPDRWLRGVSRYRATTSGGPDFAYDLCVRKVDPADHPDLDLSSWRVAFNGAEPIRPATMHAFVERFAPLGFRPSALFPCYGLAESTLIVTGVEKDHPPVLGDYDAEALEGGRYRPAAPGARAMTLVGCGNAYADHEVLIVQPDTAERALPGEIGEIWVAGPSVAVGYWANPDATTTTFGARIAGEPEAGPYLRTGDLGFIDDGQLYVVGRIKDVLILHGRNYHPHDIEELAERGHPSVRPHSTAAFAVEDDTGVRVTVVLEAEEPDGDPSELLRAVRRAIAEGLELQADHIVACRPTSVPKTTSGKVQRRLCRTMLARGELAVIAEWRGKSLA